MPSACLPLFTPTASIITKASNPTKAFSFYNPPSRNKLYGNSIICKASSSSSSSSITDFDLYDLLGIDSSSDQSQIKVAYRSLQKRCHPDIAGPPGHDMAIILNEAYSVLSDPSSRLAYDKEQAKTAEFRGYTGKPLYSAWFGPENEQRAVFVDEVKCVGCLKCALFAEKTFAIESVYGRARVVAQWADPEHKIQEAIGSCPVDCISVVERSNLAALEFLMSKQPRGNVRMSTGNAVGTRVSNIFVDVDKFQAKFRDSMDKASTQGSKEADLQREAKMSAIQAIRAISNWLYWQSPNEGLPTTRQELVHIARKSIEPNIKKLRDAAAARKLAKESCRPIGRIPSNCTHTDEYWTPLVAALPATTQNSTASQAASNPSSTKQWKKTNGKDHRVSKKKQRSLVSWGLPMGPAAVAAFTVRLQVGEGMVGRVEDHMGGSLALEIVNSAWLPVILAGITWYIIGTVVVELVDAFVSREKV
ncbi:hypothetical protein L1049_022482 [Liquidambar formosana]|uniref:J domain-containing protein n=1 Tax=Liquidambar formosana TaxID=63359 RepID=A0AAP0RCI1_LIQFO